MSRLMAELNRADQSCVSIWCKICGITRHSDAQRAQALGADALGFNFYPQSPRYVQPIVAAEICKQIDCVRVGLFVDSPRNEVEQVLDVCELDLLQFHGEETPEYCASFGIPYMKVLGVGSEAPSTQRLEVKIRSYADAWAVLLDTHAPKLKGGTGTTFDWSLWPKDISVRLVLAGGLEPLNVREAIEATRPFGVDVASGVEGAVKGEKDPQRLEQFMQEVRGARHNNAQ